MVPLKVDSWASQANLLQQSAASFFLLFPYIPPQDVGLEEECARRIEGLELGGLA